MTRPIGALPSPRSRARRPDCTFTTFATPRLRGWPPAGRHNQRVDGKNRTLLAALIYQHATDERDQAIAVFLDEQIAATNTPRSRSLGASIVPLRRT